MADSKKSQLKQLPTCFVIMPISDVEPYGAGHFRRVYEHLIVPACKMAGFEPLLASDVKEANMIVIDVLQRLHTAEMVLCDLSGRNPNVLFELGFRQAFNRPVTLIKDLRTERIFDISGLRDILYDESLRIDTAQTTIAEIADRMRATFDAADSGTGGVNSLVQLLGVEQAVVPQRTPISSDTQILLDAVRDLSDRVRALEPASSSRSARIRRAIPGSLLEVQISAGSETLRLFTELLNDTGDVYVLETRSVGDTHFLSLTVRPSLKLTTAEQNIRSLALSLPELEVISIA